MSKLQELSETLEERLGGKVSLRESSSNREILDLKLKLEKIGNGLNAIKGLPGNGSPILKESLQHSLDGRAHVSDNKKNNKAKTDYELLTESLPEKKSQKSNSLQTDLDARASEDDIRESVIIDLQESSYENNTFSFTLSEGSPEDFVGKKIYMNRPTAAEKKDRPERSLKDWVATITEAAISKGKVMVKAFIHDDKVAGLLENPVAKKALGITMDNGNFCFVSEGGIKLS